MRIKPPERGVASGANLRSPWRTSNPRAVRLACGNATWKSMDGQGKA
jgi:hypothetical protein